MRRQILIIRFGSLGDIILTSATLRNLKINFPDCEISYLTKARFSSVVELIDGVDKVFTIDDNPTWREWYNLVDALDSRQFDTVIDLHGKLGSWLVRKVVTANTRLVYPKRRWERYRLTKDHQIPATWPHTIDLYNAVVTQLGGEVYCRRPQLSIRQDLTTKPPWPVGEPAVIIAPGAAHPTKQWPGERFAHLAKSIHKTHRAHIIWVTEKEEPVPEALREVSRSHTHVLANWSIDQLSSLFTEATALVSNDSGLMHLASAVGLPVVAAFGPTHPALGFAPRGLVDRVVQVDEPCRPCSLHGKTPCFREEQFCFTRLTAEMVAAVVSALIERRLNASPALFVDRDGTILVNRHYRNDPDMVRLESGALEGLKLAAKAGYKIIVISNQSGIARGLTTEAAVISTTARMVDLLSQAGISVTGSYYCPHHATEGTIPRFTVACECRKPAVGMIERAAIEHNLDLRRSAVVGDSQVDINLGRAAGVTPMLVRTGYGLTTEATLIGSSDGRELIVGDNLQSAIQLYLGSRHD